MSIVYSVMSLIFLCSQVKRNVSDLTNIPVRHQQWEGWPASASDDSVRGTHRHPHALKNTLGFFCRKDYICAVCVWITIDPPFRVI